MEKVNWKLSNKLGSHWIKVKFYQEKPKDTDAKILKDVKFCQAIKLAIIQPVILDKTSLNCAGANCAFGWNDSRDKFVERCRDKNSMPLNTLESILSQAYFFKKPVEYIGLNTMGKPDLVLSYVSPEQAMAIVKIYQANTGKTLDVSLGGMMSICGSVAVKTHLSKDITFSFGCEDSRKSAGLGRDIMAVGIPERLFEMFVGNEQYSIK
ncbi:MAG: DUF169 domain-containing protein [Candidatus Omnitrophica bacterium]|nr:DUF169 domain-containing protein [Candidatus Omnitrophota bacterium]MCK5288774.1 DUF169 domain-containing protein [Candidatus Omnitrophota bacterium]